MEKRTDSWQDSALCAQWEVDPEIFFAQEGNRRQEPQAKAICGACAVKANCLLFAMQNNEQYGIWGGLTQTERQQYTSHMSDGQRQRLTLQEMRYFLDAETS